MMKACSRSQFSPSLLQPRFLFSNNFYSSRLLNFSNTILMRDRHPLKISSLSATFVSKDFALSFSVATKTLNSKGLTAKK